VQSKRELDQRHGLVECRWRVRNQRGKLVALASVEAVWRRAAQPAPEPSRQPVLI
jgi:hypothetical protein